MKIILLAGLLALSGCGFSAADRREIAEAAVVVAVGRAAEPVRKRLVKDGFTPEEADRFAAWLKLRAAEIADDLLDQVKED